MDRGMNWEELTAEERLVAEQAVMNLRTLNRASGSPGGHPKSDQE